MTRPARAGPPRPPKPAPATAEPTEQPSSSEGSLAQSDVRGNDLAASGSAEGTKVSTRLELPERSDNAARIGSKPEAALDRVRRRSSIRGSTRLAARRRHRARPPPAAPLLHCRPPEPASDVSPPAVLDRRGASGVPPSSGVSCPGLIEARQRRRWHVPPSLALGRTRTSPHFRPSLRDQTDREVQRRTR